MTDQTENPTTFTVIVTNTVDEKLTELYRREVEFGKKDTAMKYTRQKIRDLGATIRQATVTNSEDGSEKTIAFTDLDVTETPAATRTPQRSNARKNAEAIEPSELDIEIISIANDEDADTEAKTEALSEYTRHQLIRAFNVHTETEENRLSHYSTKAKAIESLIS